MACIEGIKREAREAEGDAAGKLQRTAREGLSPVTGGVRSNVLTANGRGLSRRTTGARRCAASAANSTSWWARYRRSIGRKRWPTASIRCSRVGQLLLLRNLHPGVCDRAQAHPPPGPSVAAEEIQAYRSRIPPVSRQPPGARARAAEPHSIPTPSLVGDTLTLVREPDAGNPPVRFDEREVETEHGELVRHRQAKAPDNGYAEPKPPRHLSTLLVNRRYQ